MKLNITRYSLQIVPEDSRYPCDERDTAFIEEVLGLRKAGDSIRLRRINSYGLGCIAYLEAKKEEIPVTEAPAWEGVGEEE